MNTLQNENISVNCIKQTKKKETNEAWNGSSFVASVHLKHGVYTIRQSLAVVFMHHQIMRKIWVLSRHYTYYYLFKIMPA